MSPSSSGQWPLALSPLSLHHVRPTAALWVQKCPASDVGRRGSLQRGRFTSGKLPPGFDAVIAPPGLASSNGLVLPEEASPRMSGRGLLGDTAINGDGMHLDGSPRDLGTLSRASVSGDGHSEGGPGHTLPQSSSGTGLQKPYKASSPVQGVNNAAEAGAVASGASKEDSARAEAALKTPKQASSVVWHSGESFKKSRFGQSVRPALSRPLCCKAHSPPALQEFSCQVFIG
jgi:hypothetical protein